MARLVSIALVLACAAGASAQPFPSVPVEMIAVAGSADSSPASLARAAVALNEAALPDGSTPYDTSAIEWSPADGSSGRRKHDDSLLNGLLIGAGAGTVLCIVYFHDEVPAAGLPLIVGAYALVGAWIDARVETVQPADVGALSQPSAQRRALRASVDARVRF